MCGIAGIFHYRAADKRVDRPLLERMTRTIAHRGPDGEGFHIDGPLGFGHRRLAIVDLSETGSQPMSNDDRSLWINYNGEFYNHREHRPRIAARHTFRGPSDTETFLRLFEERGVACLEEIAGIFAVAFWDNRRRVLTLARDPLGVKQLYYHDDGHRIVFASEIKALLCCKDVPREIDEEGVNQYIHFQTPVFERTFFKGIRQLRAGEYIEVSSAGMRRQTYWRLSNFEGRGGSPESNVAALREQLASVIRDQLMSDVPVGSFFSGGIDSCTVAAYAKQVGQPPRCFGVHFADQGVADERPYQEAAAKALGLDLELMTLDGSSFPDDLKRAIYHQDQPVIGAAMLPMYHVSKLAARKVKVCLGGQAADEIFGGYARYALANPWWVIRSWFQGRQRTKGKDEAMGAGVAGNLFHDVADAKTWWRLLRNAKHAADWRGRYFENFVKVPEGEWRDILADNQLLSREQCRATFEDGLSSSGARDPATQVMHWDMQTYLTGLFHQDDRMSMAHGLESRVPLADPRLVRFAFQLGFDLKFRAGATKWILRKAVSDVIPREVLNRRKVGFATPAERWMKESHLDFVRDTLLSSRARQRGIWNWRQLEKRLSNPARPLWFDIVWKALCIETWAREFLDRPESKSEPQGTVIELNSPPPASPLAGHRLPTVAQVVREARDLGPANAMFRAKWELKLRAGLIARFERAPARLAEDVASRATSEVSKSFAPAKAVAAAMQRLIPAEQRQDLIESAEDSARGRILCFSRWTGDYGQPIDWHQNPLNGRRWNPRIHWTRALRDEGRVGDVKLSWEAGRFPQAYRMARAAAFEPSLRPRLAEALSEQITSFIEQNRYGLGIHWISGQELAIRAMAWSFALTVLGQEPAFEKTTPAIIQALHQMVDHIDCYFDFTRRAVPNNHLLAECLGLLLGSTLFPDSVKATDWRAKALAVLDEQTEAQFFADGGQFQDSHNYHRAVMLYYLWAAALLRNQNQPLPKTWISRMESSLDFLLAHQSPVDGWLPNFGPNDGSRPFVLSTCEFSDFRPVLQSLSVLTRGERLYEPGPWDEECAWLLGPAALDVPVRRRPLKSISFPASGTHVLRGNEPSTFCVFRCGDIKQRFSQIDMLSTDVWWRGQNVLVDSGSYSYNGPQKWHRHFARTESHNTVQVDGEDQMLHYRRFKTLYWTRATLNRFENEARWAVCGGEHQGFERTARCIHQRSVLFAKDDVWVIADRIVGEGTHSVRLHWLGGDFPYQYDRRQGRLTLSTRSGPFCIAVVNEDGSALSGDVVSGSEEPPRGWLSRHYGEKVEVPSLSVERRGTVPLQWVTVLSAGEAQIRVAKRKWSVEVDGLFLEFELDECNFRRVTVTSDAPRKTATA
ncbi:MAG TPA: asparagine synthase (glutamine-hydrolyzing) [Myxococcaceae bacterium]|nr:asparagine synthase (glutamine-hydrolyzing) [Myxococcaceae bacterium]